MTNRSSDWDARIKSGRSISEVDIPEGIIEPCRDFETSQPA